MDLSRRRTVLILFGMVALFVLRVSLDLGTTLRGCDEAHCAVVAARLVVDGGPLYGNVVTNYGPVIHSLAALAFRIGGLYNMAAVRAVQLAWWAVTALVIYAAARTLMGRPASLAAAGAFMLAALNPGFQEIRGEPMAALPLAASVGLCMHGVARRSLWSLLGSGVAIGVAVLAKPQAGLALPVVAACPLAAWWWGRREQKLWLTACASAAVVGGFAVTMVAVALYYALRGAGHAYFFCLWTHNWSFCRCSPAGRFFPSLPFFWGRVVRYSARETLLPLAVTGALAGLAWRPPEGEEAAPLPWRARVAVLGALLLAMWVAASPGDIPPMPLGKYIHYRSLLYAPMSLLAGLCVELAGRFRGDRRSLWVVAVALAFAYVAIPFTRQHESAAFHVRLYLTMLGAWRILAAVAAIAAAGWLLGGRRLAWLAPAAWALAYLTAPRSLGWEGAQLPAAVGLAAVGLLWQARERRSPALAGLAGIVHAAGWLIEWSPQLGLAVGAAAWLLVQPRLSRSERGALAGLYLACVVPVALVLKQIVSVGSAGYLPTARSMMDWWGFVRDALLSWRPGATLALCGLLVLTVGMRPFRAALRRVGEHGLGLLLFAVAGALAGGVARWPDPGYVAEAGTALALAAAMAIGLLMRRPAAVSDARASLLLSSGCLAAGAIALGASFVAPMCVPPLPPYDRMEAVVKPGSRVYIWGPMFAFDLPVRSRLVPATPQIGTWMLETIGLPPYGDGLLGYPTVATLDALDRALNAAPPRYVVIMDGMGATPADFPRFGPLLRTRYRVALKVDGGKLYELAPPPTSATPPTQ